MAFKSYDQTNWKLDKANFTVQERPAQDSDFPDSGGSLSTVTGCSDTWDPDAEKQARQEIKDKHLMRRVVEDITMYKKIDGAKLNLRDMSFWTQGASSNPYATTGGIGKMRPPYPFLPWNNVTGKGADYPLNSHYLLMGCDVDIQQDAGALIRARFKYMFPWQLVYAIYEA